jgi:dienelactone hydrolase
MNARASSWLVFLLLLLVVRPVFPQDAPGDAMIDKFLGRETDRINRRFLDGATTLEEWQKKRPRLRQEYLDMLGLWPLPEKTPLKATVTGTVERGNVVIELLHYQSRPGLYVTGNLYRPKKASGGREAPAAKLPAVLYVCGHSGRGRNGNKTAFQDHGMWFASNGYVCLVVDTLQLGEVAGIHHGTYREGRWWWQSLGYTPAGVECWNGIRGIDYLVSRPDVDPERIAVTGISGGGATTVWIAAADERVKCAVPVSGMSDLESYVKNKVINGHCDCMFLVNTYQWEWTTIAALIAPRPMLFANSDNDRIFPMDGNRRIIERLRKLYKLYDKADLVDDYVSKGGHDYRPDLRVAIFRWINTHIKKDKGAVKDADFKTLPGADLRVFPTDADLPRDAKNKTNDTLFVRAGSPDLPEEGKEFAKWRDGVVKELRAKSFRAFPARIPAAWVGAQDKEGWDLNTERDIIVSLSNDLQKKVRDKKTAVLLVLSPGEKVPAKVPAWASLFTEGTTVHVLRARGIDDPWTKKSPPNYVERAHALLGRTVDEGRVWDIAATVRYLDEKADGKVKWKVIGRREAGVLAAYAALFEPSIAEVVAVDPPPTHDHGPTFLNVLRVLDIPEAMGLLAPRPLTVVNADPKGARRTAQFYDLAGAKAKFRHRSIAFP